MLPMLLVLAAHAPESPYLQAAKKAATWLRQEVKKPGHTMELYSGRSGVALFYVEAFYATGDKSYLRDAERIGDDLIKAVPEAKQDGLYTGLAGIGFTLNEIGRAGGVAKYGKAAVGCVDLIVKHAKAVGLGTEWGEGNDIVAGSAGIGCFLLYCAKEMKQPAALDLARRVGNRLIEVGISDSGGTKWKMSADYERWMPNFSHGTAGVAFFLARLSEETKDRKYLDSAKAGAAYLMGQTNSDGLIYHDSDNPKELCYLGWCHGPVGTSRLFGVLHRSSGDSRYGDWIDRAAGALLKSGIPEKQTPGFWNNVGQCCGSAGVGEFFLDIYQFDRLPEQLAFAKRLTADILKRSLEGEGLKWVQAENRTQPENLQAQIGYMQGAAGIGLWLLHLDYQERGLRPKVYLPDNPFRGRHP